ncbi:hypothetical protein [Desnuesiella massiliensis]|uniref:hypothetical protein n=1 Tax=Desnuesiella massiliensis TaxID=1650662 RepID=UPI0006E13E8A|nr:hypothetical protein [Desnuesiella massiliensis]
MKKKIILLLILILCMAAVWRYNSNDKLKLGRYKTSNGNSWVDLKENNKFSFNRHIAASHLPEGTFDIKDKELILVVSDKEKYVFTIKDKGLVFKEAKDFGGIVKPGTVFEFSHD